MVALGAGVGLLAFGAPAGLPPLGGPGTFWAVLAVLCIVFGVVGFTHGLGPQGGRGREPADGEPVVRANPPPAGGIEAKLRELLRLREEDLITEDEYQRKRADILEKW
jgi:hypothetical protein